MIDLVIRTWGTYKSTPEIEAIYERGQLAAKVWEAVEKATQDPWAKYQEFCVYVEGSK